MQNLSLGTLTSVSGKKDDQQSTTVPVWGLLWMLTHQILCVRLYVSVLVYDTGNS